MEPIYAWEGPMGCAFRFECWADYRGYVESDVRIGRCKLSHAEVIRHISVDLVKVIQSNFYNSNLNFGNLLSRVLVRCSGLVADADGTHPPDWANKWDA